MPPRPRTCAQVFLKGGEATTRTETASAARAATVRLRLFAEGRQSSQVVNLLQIEGEDQVTLKVTIAEVRREVLKQLGFDNLVSNSTGLTVAQLGAPNADSAPRVVGGGLAALFKSSIGKYDISTYLSALEQAKVVKHAGRADVDGHFRPGRDLQFRAVRCSIPRRTTTATSRSFRTITASISPSSRWCFPPAASAWRSRPT